MLRVLPLKVTVAVMGNDRPAAAGLAKEVAGGVDSKAPGSAVLVGDHHRGAGVRRSRCNRRARDPSVHGPGDAEARPLAARA